jgi:adenylate cyclase
MSGGCRTFGEYRFDRDSGVLTRGDEFVSIGQRGAHLLGALLDRAGEVLTQAELLDAGWPGLAVEESNLSVQIAHLRKVLGPAPEGGEWIATVPRIGYRFALARPGVMPTHEEARPSIAVLPFRNLTSDAEQQLFADGLVEDIINTLSKLSGLAVIARSSSFAFKGREVDARDAARELGVRYILEGSLQKSIDRIRITVRLNDTLQDRLVWSERYDRELSDLFVIQDEIALRLATEMQVIFLHGEEARLRYTTTSNVEAWTWYMKGLATVLWPERRLPPGEDMVVAREYWEKALALDPDSAALHGSLGFAHVWNARFRIWGERSAALAEATHHVERALELEPDYPEATLNLAMIRLIQGRFGEAEEAARRSVLLQPSSPKIANFAAYVLTATGHPDEAIVHIEKSRRLNPYHHPIHLGFLGNALRLAGRTREAIDVLEEFGSRVPGLGGRDLVIAYERAGMHEEAKEAAARLLSHAPDFSISKWIDTQFRSDAAEFDADIAARRPAGQAG